MAHFQVNQTNAEEFRQQILVAPRDNRAGHHLMNDLKEGDYVFHYDSKRKLVHAVSMVLPWSFEAAKKKAFELGGTNVKPIGRLQGSFVSLMYAGPHLTAEAETKDHALVLVKTLAEGLEEPNFFPKKQIYLAKIDPDEAQAVLSRVTAS